MFIRLLYRLFHRQFKKIWFEEQKLSASDIPMKLAFIDSTGVEYYAYQNDMDLHYKRYLRVQKCLNEIKYSLPSDELDAMFETMIDAINHHVKGKSQPRLDVVAVIAQEGLKRREHLIPAEIIYDMVGCLVLTKDEINNQHVFDLTVHEQKCKRFMADNEKGPIAGFFYKSGLSIHMDFLNELASEPEEYIQSLSNMMNQSQEHLVAFRTEIIRYLATNGLSHLKERWERLLPNPKSN